jgi:helicase
MLAMTPDMPRLYLRKGDKEWLDEIVEKREGELAGPPPEDPDEYEFYLASLKVALMLLDWIEEKPDDYIYERYDVGPGDLYSFTQTAEWLVHAAAEISKLLGYTSRFKELIVLRERVKHGVRTELLELVSIKGIGRVRARALFAHGFRSLADIAKASEGELARVPGIGPTLAKRLKEAVSSGELSVEQPLPITGLDAFF